MQFDTEFFWYQFLVTPRTRYIFVPVYGANFPVYGVSASISGTRVIGITIRTRVS